jgi:long-chain acyl-CoA synthetase
MGTNLASIVTETAERIPDGIAYKLDDNEVNWQAVDEGSARVAGLLKEKGLEPGDRVGIMLPNVPYFPIAYFGVLRAGGAVVPMNVLLKPKGAELTHDNMLANAKASRELFSTGDDDIVLGALPLFHAFGQTCCMNACAVGGATLTFIPRFDPAKALEIIERDKVTMFSGVPTMYNAMLNDKSREERDTSSLKTCTSGGSAMPGELLRGFEKAFDCMILEGYGLSETSPVASFNHPDKERKVGSIGTPIEGVEMKVVDDDRNDVEQGEVGEIAIKGHNVMKGYWNRQEATDEAIQDGWFLTGDMAKVDEDGYFFIVDRKKELIIRGGYNVYPREIEEVLYEHEGVLEAAVIGVPDESMGEEVGAAVVLKEGQDVSADDLKAYVKEQVAGYKYPRKVWFVDELPKGPTGKILKKDIEVPEEAKTS